MSFTNTPSEYIQCDGRTTKSHPKVWLTLPTCFFLDFIFYAL